MPWYISIVLVFAVAFVGCQKSNVQVPTVNADVNSSKNFMIMEALYNEYGEQNITKSIENYEQLYKTTNDSIYLKSAVKLAFANDEMESIEGLLEEALQKFPDDLDVKKMYVKSLMQKKDFKKASFVMSGIIKKEKSAENYFIYGMIHYFEGKYQEALRLMKKSYQMNLSENTLIKIATLLDEKMNERKSAISHLESYVKLNKASEIVYFYILKLYSKDSNINGIISTYKSMYREFKEEQYAKKVVELLMYNHKSDEAIKFLEEEDTEHDVLIDLYAKEYRFEDAMSLCEKLYKKSGDATYLGTMAIYEYEKSDGNPTKEDLKSISKKFEEVIEKIQSPLFLNYYGYLLIDHNEDIQKGITLVKMALEREPDSAYYLDSLAWGYYKLNRCKEALDIINKIEDKNSEREIKEHYELILKCVEGQK